MIHTVSCQKSVSVASTLITRLICGNATLIRLLYPASCGRKGNMSPKCARAYRSQRASQWKPSIACITARHNNSE